MFLTCIVNYMDTYIVHTHTHTHLGVQLQIQYGYVDAPYYI